MISISRVQHRIGQADILRNITLDLPAEGITALIGPNGAGKSTLMSLMARLTPLQAGQITVEGLDITRTPSRDLAQRMAILPQNATVFSRLRVKELVAFGRWPHHRGRPGPSDHAQVAAALQSLALDDLSDRFLDELSGGQRQRAHLAMALAQDTDWLLLDEPLAALDMAHARGLMQTLARLRDQGKSIVLVVHEVNYAAAWADYVVALKAGRVVANGPPDEVFTEDVLSSIYDTRLRVTRQDGRPLVLHHL